MKTISKLKVNGEEAGIKVVINETNNPDLPGLAIDSGSFYKSDDDMLFLQLARAEDGFKGGVRLKKMLMVVIVHIYKQIAKDIYASNSLHAILKMIRILA